MKTQFALIFLLALLLSGCGKKVANVHEPTSTGVALQAELSQRQSVEFLAYSHRFTIDLSEDEIQAAYSATVEACAADTQHGCTILDANVSLGTYKSAYIKLRIKPEGVRPVLEIAAGFGKIVQEKTHVDDLAQPVADNKKRLAMLESHRNRLLLLHEKASNDIQALIKISEELSKVQSQLENAAGQEAYLKERIAKDIVEIDFSSIASRSFWRPISRALSGFTGNLAEGISDTILAAAYLLPWLVLGIPALFLLRMILRRGKRTKG
jgi:hypothetical protein